MGKVVGLTGGSGAGKSVGANIFLQNGFHVIDGDKIAHLIYKTSKKCVDEIKNAFGESVVDQNGNVLRKKLADIVFSDPKKLDILNSITHKYIIEELKNQMEKHKKSNILLDIPLLFETGLDKSCNYTVCILSDTEKRIKRIIERDKISKESALKRISNQKTNEEFIKLCDFSIENNDDINTFTEKVQNVIKEILKD